MDLFKYEIGTQLEKINFEILYKKKDYYEELLKHKPLLIYFFLKIANFVNLLTKIYHGRKPHSYLKNFTLNCTLQFIYYKIKEKN